MEAHPAFWLSGLRRLAFHFIFNGNVVSLIKKLL